MHVDHGEILNALLGELMLLYSRTRPVMTRECPGCGYVGNFGWYGHPPRADCRCPKCGSLERHRLICMALNRQFNTGGRLTLPSPVLHFAPERLLQAFIKPNVDEYIGADISGKADRVLDLENMDLPDASVGTVLAIHVLEHVDDAAASAEILRVLRPGGLFLAMVPIVEGWETTYEDADLPESLREAHYGQHDHVRFYGRDFRERITRCGLELIEEITAEGPEVVRYGLMRGEKVFVFRRPA